MNKYKYRTIGNDWKGFRNQRKIPFLPVWINYCNLSYKFFNQHDAEQHLTNKGLLNNANNRWDVETIIYYYGEWPI